MVKKKFMVKKKIFITKPNNFTPVASSMVVPKGQTSGGTPVLWKNNETDEITNKNPGTSGGRNSSIRKKIDVTKTILRNDNPINVASITKTKLPITNSYKKAPIIKPREYPTPSPIKPKPRPTLPRKHIRPSAGPKIDTPWNVPKPIYKKYPFREGQKHGKWIYKNGEWIERKRMYF